MRRLPLGPIEAFMVAARSTSLAQAAMTMGLTVPALSRRIQLLEAELGVRLFRRLPRGVRLTEAGETYFAALSPAWDGVRDATEAARRRGRRNAVRVSVIPTFAANWLVPRLGRFHSQHRDIDLDVETAADLVDLERRGDLDCAIRLGQGPWPGLSTERLLPVDAVPIVSPGFRTAHGVPTSPAALLDYPLIESSHQPAFWQEWFAAAGVDGSAARYRGFDNLQLVHEAAAAGMGIALGLSPLLRPYLESGRLETVFPTPLRLARSFHLLRRPGHGMPDRPLAQFRAWLLEEAALQPDRAVAPS